jgi:predicted acylesterase/phospholipase RssA
VEDTKAVIKALHEREGEKQGDAFVFLLFIMGGIMRGIIGAGQMFALVTKGYRFDIVVGNSIGAIVAAYCLCSTATLVKGLNLFIRESSKHIFVWKPWRFGLKRPVIIDMDAIFNLIRRGEYSLDMGELFQNLNESGTRFYVGVTDEDGNYVLLDLRELGLEAILASMALFAKVEILGKLYGDGGRYQVPIKQILEHFKEVTHVLILANVLEEEKDKMTLGQLWNEAKELIVWWKSSRATRKAIKEALRKNTLNKLNDINSGRTIGVLYAPVKLDSLELDPRVLKKAFIDAFRGTLDILQKIEAGR